MSKLPYVWRSRFHGHHILSKTGGSRKLTRWEVFWWKLGILTPHHFDRKYFGQ